MKIGLIALILMTFVNLSFSQNSWGIEGKFHSGYLAVHRPSISHLPQDFVLGGELGFFLDLKSENGWASVYSAPRVGINGFFSQTSNAEILGHLFGGLAYGDLPFFRNENHSFSARVGTGLAYASKVYDTEENLKNNAISTHFNVIVQLSLNYRKYFNQSEVGIGFGLNHFSNGANKLPNLGLNYPTITLTYGRINGLMKSRTKTRPTDFASHKWCFGVNLIGSVKEGFPTGGRKYPIVAVNGFVRKIFSPKMGVEMAVDGIYKTAIFDYLPEYEKRPIDILQFGFFAGHVLSFDRFSTILGMGVYFRDRYLPENRFYHRIGMRYGLRNNLQLGLTLKSNWGKADYVEWSVGYIFNRKKQ